MDYYFLIIDIELCYKTHLGFLIFGQLIMDTDLYIAY